MRNMKTAGLFTILEMEEKIQYKSMVVKREIVLYLTHNKSIAEK